MRQSTSPEKDSKSNTKSKQQQPKQAQRDDEREGKSGRDRAKAVKARFFEHLCEAVRSF